MFWQTEQKHLAFDLLTVNYTLFWGLTMWNYKSQAGGWIEYRWNYDCVIRRMAASVTKESKEMIRDAFKCLYSCDGQSTERKRIISFYNWQLQLYDCQAYAGSAILNDSATIIFWFGFWVVGRTKEATWRRLFGLWDFMITMFWWFID